MPQLLKMSAEHVGDVAELERLCFSEPWSEKSLELLLGNGAAAYVAVEDGKAVAYGGMLSVLDEGQITNIAVHPNFRRRGIGRTVTEALLKNARENKLSAVFLEVRASNRAAEELYRSLGFAAVGERKNFYRLPVEAAIIMKYVVDAADSDSGGLPT